MNETKPILFATDGSPSAEEAQKEAFELAGRLGAPLLGVSVAQAALPAVGYTAYGYSNVVAELSEAERKRVKKLLASVARGREAEGVRCSTVAADGLVVDQICAKGERPRRAADRRGFAWLGRREAPVLRQRLDRPRPLRPLPRARRTAAPRAGRACRGSMSSAAQPDESTDVILRDGSTLRLRAPAAEDAEALVQFFSGLSEQSRYLRFHGFPALGPSLVEPVLEPDWQDRGALVGSLDGRIVAVANWVRLRDPRAAEVAFAVGDDFQGHGVGTRLLEQLAERAAHAGIEEFVAEVLPENAAMLGVFRDAGFSRP